MPHGTIRNKFASFASQLLFSVDAIEASKPRKANSSLRSE